MNRAVQLDALLLEDDVCATLAARLQLALHSFSIYSWHREELSKYLRLLLTFYTLATARSTYPMRLYDLQLDTVRRLFPLARIAALSVLTAFEDDIAHLGWPPWWKRAFGVLKLLNFVLFLRNGRYASLPLRLLQLQIKPIGGSEGRMVIDDAYTMRQMIWQSLTELLVVSCPHYKPASRWLAQQYQKIAAASGKGSASVASPEEAAPGTCAICGLRGTMAARLQCSHHYCYYCLQRQSAGVCLRCSSV